MTSTSPSPLAHLELHTHDRAGASSFYRELLGWLPEHVEAAGREDPPLPPVYRELRVWLPEHVEAAGREYLALDLGNGLGGGIVECGTERPLWLPYVFVPDIRTATEQVERLGPPLLFAARAAHV